MSILVNSEDLENKQRKKMSEKAGDLGTTNKLDAISLD